jgi:hypothetical protein
MIQLVTAMKSSSWMIDAMVTRKAPFCAISPDFALRAIEKNDISWAGKSFRADEEVTHRVKNIWEIRGERYELASVAEGFISWGDEDVEDFRNSWLTSRPGSPYREIAEFVGKLVAESFREELTCEAIKGALKAEGLFPRS